MRRKRSLPFIVGAAFGAVAFPLLFLWLISIEQYALTLVLFIALLVANYWFNYRRTSKMPDGE